MASAALQATVESLRPLFPSQRIPEIVTSVLSAPGNHSCADCTSTSPRWGIINHGTVVCDLCCSVHRSLGRCVSIVAPLQPNGMLAGTFALELLPLLGNALANSVWEASMSKGKPLATEKTEHRSRFIKEKYKFGKYIETLQGYEKDTLRQMFFNCVMAYDIPGAYRLLSRGVDPNTIDSATSCTALHLAARAGNKLLVELLLYHGASASSLDKSGCTAAGMARESGYYDVALRLERHTVQVFQALQEYATRRRPYLRLSHADEVVCAFAKGELQKLSDDEIRSITQDLYDELDRRLFGEVWEMIRLDNIGQVVPIAFLPVTDDFPKIQRQQTRQKLATLSSARFTVLVADIVNEIRTRENASEQFHVPQDSNAPGRSRALLSPVTTWDPRSEFPSQVVGGEPSSARVEELSQQVEQLTSNIDKMHQVIVTLQSRVGTLEAQNNQLLTSIGTHEEAISELQRENTDLATIVQMQYALEAEYQEASVAASRIGSPDVTTQNVLVSTAHFVPSKVANPKPIKPPVAPGRRTSFVAPAPKEPAPTRPARRSTACATTVLEAAKMAKRISSSESINSNATVITTNTEKLQPEDEASTQSERDSCGDRMTALFADGNFSDTEDSEYNSDEYDASQPTPTSRERAEAWQHNVAARVTEVMASIEELVAVLQRNEFDRLNSCIAAIMDAVPSLCLMFETADQDCRKLVGELQEHLSGICECSQKGDIPAIMDTAFRISKLAQSLVRVAEQSKRPLSILEN